MHLLSKYNKGIRFLLWVIDFYSKYACVVSLKSNKKCNSKTITDVSQKVWDESSHKTSKTWVNKGSANYEGKSIAVDQFIETLKNKIYKYMNSISKNTYIDKLPEIVKSNNNIHTSFKIRPDDVEPISFIFLLNLI